MKRILQVLSVAVPALVLLGAAVMFGGGFFNRGGYAVTSGAERDPPAAFSDGRPNLVAAMFYSAWCGSCAVLEPKLREVIPDFEGRAVEFAKFDFSMGQSDDLAAQAEELGVGPLYENHKGETGYMALIDRRTGGMIGQIMRDDTKAEIAEKIETAISGASTPILAGL